MLDEICHHYYGQSSGIIEQVLVANPGVAALGVELPVGTLVTLPDVSGNETDTEQVNLWS